MKLSLPKGFNKMSEGDQREYISRRLREAEAAYNYWARQSRAMAYGKITTLDYDRPDLELMKDDNG